MAAYVVDTETTGAEPAEVIELAVLKCSNITDAPEPVFYGRFKPAGRILFSAMAAHHILPQELEGEQDSVLAKAYLPTDMEYMIGHNIDYDWAALGCPPTKRICTLAISRRIWPGNDGHSLSCLAYHLSNDLVTTRALLREAHGAAVDAELACGILHAQLQSERLRTISTWEQLYLFSEDARIPRIFTFGKHKGADINDIAQRDPGYLLWVARQTDMDAYVKEACRLALKGQLTP